MLHISNRFWLGRLCSGSLFNTHVTLVQNICSGKGVLVLTRSRTHTHFVSLIEQVSSTHNYLTQVNKTGLSRSDPRWNISSATELHNLLINFMRLMIHLYLPPTAKSEMA